MVLSIRSMGMTDVEGLTYVYVSAGGTAVSLQIWLKDGVLMHDHIRYILLNNHVNLCQFLSCKV